MHPLQARLEHEAAARNSKSELCYARPDPLLVASRYRDESIALICALFGYGNAHAIVRFLESLDFDLLLASEREIEQVLSGHYYRFQSSEDVVGLFIALKRLREVESIERLFVEGYRREHCVLEGLWHFMRTLRDLYPRKSRGYNFLVGSLPKKGRPVGTHKRYMMYLRWMVRHDALDMGLWQGIDKRHLIMPLDTHTFQVARKLGLLSRKSYDMKAALELTERLRDFDPDDPVKYDFALYRIGQEHVMDS
ncbi:MAG TPA: TIGR02757 family protein [Campylobacterales bacterium]|nr:TIGR02757 family protein [Campylobacterales bacterium]